MTARGRIQAEFPLIYRAGWGICTVARVFLPSVEKIHMEPPSLQVM